MDSILHPAQAEIAKDLHRFRVLVCGRKFGKTTLGAYEIMGFAVAKANSRIMYISPTLEDSRRLMWDRIKDNFRGAQAGTKSNDTRLELKIPTIGGGTSTIFLGSWEKVDNYRGDEFDFIIFDEVQDYKDFWEGWQEAMRPTLTPRLGSALFMGTPKGFNHFYDLFNFQVKSNDFKSFHFTSYDNPHIPVSEIEAAKTAQTPDRFAQEYMASFQKTEGLVYKEFDRKIHLYDELPDRNYEKVAGIDWGYTHPAAVPHIYIDGDDYYVEDEFYKSGKTDVQVAEYVAACQFNAVYPDPESPSAIKELENRSQNIREVLKGKDSVKNGIQTVREMLKSRRLHINKNCLNIIHEFETYSYDNENKQAMLKEQPIKENDHLLDALRYVVMMKSPSSGEMRFRNIDGVSTNDPYERARTHFGSDQGVFLGTDGGEDSNPY